MPKPMTANELAQIDSWINGVTYEVCFWKGRLTKKWRQSLAKRLKTKNLLNLEFFPHDQIKAHLDGFNLSEYHILDVGCGLAFHTCADTCVENTAIHFHYVDPLAPFYNEIIHELKMDVPQIEFSFVEYLSAFFEIDSTPLIIIRNALDHSFDPVKGIVECVNVLMRGGILYLAHIRNEAEHNNYLGFHQYNIDAANGELIIWGRNYRVNINELLSGIAAVATKVERDIIYAKITKLEDAAHLLTKNKDCNLLCLQLMHTIQKVSSIKFVFMYQCKKIFQYFFFFFSNLAPVSLKENVKKAYRSRSNG